MSKRCLRPLGALTVILLIATAAPLESQQRPEPGSTVRFQAPRYFADAFVGELVALSAESLTVEYAQGLDPVTVPLDAVTRLDVSRGTRSHIGLGVGIGVGAGIVLGAGIGALIAPRGDLGDPLDEPCPSCGAQIGVLFGAPSGALLGLIAGAAARTHRWEAVSVELIRTGTTRQPGLGIGLSLRF